MIPKVNFTVSDKVNACCPFFFFFLRNGIFNKYECMGKSDFSLITVPYTTQITIKTDLE